MARIVEDSYAWSITSTGAGKAHRVSAEASALSFWFVGSFGSSATGSTAATATVQAQATFGSSGGPWAALASASTLSHPNSAVVVQVSGPLEWVRPYVSAQSASTETITCRLIAN